MAWGVSEAVTVDRKWGLRLVLFSLGLGLPHPSAVSGRTADLRGGRENDWANSLTDF